MWTLLPELISKVTNLNLASLFWFINSGLIRLNVRLRMGYDITQPEMVNQCIKLKFSHKLTSVEPHHLNRCMILSSTKSSFLMADILHLRRLKTTCPFFRCLHDDELWHKLPLHCKTWSNTKNIHNSKTTVVDTSNNHIFRIVAVEISIKTNSFDHLFYVASIGPHLCLSYPAILQLNQFEVESTSRKIVFLTNKPKKTPKNRHPHPNMPKLIYPPVN